MCGFFIYRPNKYFQIGAWSNFMVKLNSTGQTK